MTKFQYKEEYQYLTSSMLNVTDDCNLSCKYCFVEQHPHYMTFQIAKDAVDWLYNNLQKKIQLNYKNDKKCSLYFFGGEPTLCYDSVIVPIVNYCNEKYPNIFNFGITTNGTLLNKEKIDFFKKNKFSILLSIDGDKETQDYNRPCRDCQQSSFDLLKKNIPYLLEQYPNLTFRSTGYAPTIHKMFENYLYAESLGFKNWITILDKRHNWSEEQKQILAEELRKIYFYRIQQISKDEVPMECSRIEEYLHFTAQLIYNKDFYIKNIEPNVERCGLATTNGAIGWDGSIYGCQEQVSKDNKNIFYIGNLYNNGIDIEKHKNLLETYYQTELKALQKFDNCQNCILNSFCSKNMFSCPSTLFDLFTNMESMTDIECFLRQELFKNSLLTLELLQGTNYLENILKKGEKEYGILQSGNN